MSLSQFQYKRIDEVNLNDFQKLYQNCYGEYISLEVISRKFCTRQFGAEWIGYLAYENDLAVAFYGVYPCRAIYDNTEILVAQSGDTMTHTDFRGKGLFVELAKRTYELAREECIQIVFGFPNANSYPGFKRKLDWVHFDDIESYIIPVRTISWYRLHKHLRIPDRWHDNWIKQNSARIKEGNPFPSSCEEENCMAIVHNEDFFNYKKFSGSILSKIAGVNVWIKFSHEFLWIGDIDRVETWKIDKVIIGLKKLAAILFIPNIRFQGSTGTFLAKYFNEKGRKMEITHPIAGLNLIDNYPIEKMKFTFCDNDTF
jgi:GNAT superfamily N-acetyltransferase